MITLFEKFINNENTEEIKSIIFDKAVQTLDKDIIDFFINKGYNINTDYAIDYATESDEIFRYFLSKNADIENISTENLIDLDVQKALIDYGHEVYVKDSIGFNKNLKDDPKYADIFNASDEMKKYNL